MEHWAGTNDNKIVSVYTCITCVEILKHFDEEELESGYIDNMLTQENNTPELLLEELIRKLS